MNHVQSPFLLASETALSARSRAKLRTRQIVLDAAKRLFTERGYGDATVRGIAHEAGLSTGAVFANFEDKADLFNQVLAVDYETLAARMRQAADREPLVHGALLAALGAGYEFHLAQLPLLQAAISVSWSQGRQDERRSHQSQHDMRAVITELLRRAIDDGELASQTDLALVSDLIWQAYIGNYRLALFDGAGLAKLRTLVAKQITVILAGCIARR